MQAVSIIKDAVSAWANDQGAPEGLPVQVKLCDDNFDGHYTVVCFPLAGPLKKKPEELGEELGAHLTETLDIVQSYNVVKGFLNLELVGSYWVSTLLGYTAESAFTLERNSKQVMIESCSPNTNKPLHLGHLRNIFLGHAIYKILDAAGYDVIRCCLYNDRGTNISKSIWAYENFGDGQTPESAGVKGDKFVGDFYVRYDKEYKAELESLMAAGKSKEEAEAASEAALAVKTMTIKWEENDPDVRAKWKQMNDWVYSGFESTYNSLGIGFDKLYYESETYLLGKSIVEEGLEKGIFFSKEDGSVWIDLEPDGLDEKLLQRSDGTAVYMTQDMGTAQQRFEDNDLDLSTYVVADEQDYHFRVLFLIMKKLGREWADKLHHTSYGMVDLPSGKMKSREGTVVDADDLVAEMLATAQAHTDELGKIDEFSTEEAQALYRAIGLGALKFFLLKVAPKKRMMFNPEESVDFHGFTGPFIQYTYARIQSILRKWEGEEQADESDAYTDVQPQEVHVVRALGQYPDVIREAASNHDPSVVANYIYHLAKDYNKFYTDLSVLKAEGPAKSWRVALSATVANVIGKGMDLLGIEVPQRM